MKADKMWLDGLPINNPLGTTRENQNVVVTDSIGSFVNEPSITQYSSTYNKTLVGNIVINDGNLFICNSDNSFGILYKTGEYVEKYQNLNLNFNVNNKKNKDRLFG